MAGPAGSVAENVSEEHEFEGGGPPASPDDRAPEENASAHASAIRSIGKPRGDRVQKASPLYFKKKKVKEEEVWILRQWCEKSCGFGKALSETVASQATDYP
jgi:hypothetical protein